METGYHPPFRATASPIRYETQLRPSRVALRIFGQRPYYGIFRLVTDWVSDANIGEAAKNYLFSPRKGTPVYRLTVGRPLFAGAAGASYFMYRDARQTTHEKTTMAGPYCGGTTGGIP